MAVAKEKLEAALESGEVDAVTTETKEGSTEAETEVVAEEASRHEPLAIEAQDENVDLDSNDGLVSEQPETEGRTDQ
jgi:hypothetical protein